MGGTYTKQLNKKTEKTVSTTNVFAKAGIEGGRVSAVAAAMVSCSGLTEFCCAVNQIINFYFYIHHQLDGLDESLSPSLRNAVTVTCKPK